MSTDGNDSELDAELSKERQALFEKLSNIFGPETAEDYVTPKTNETRHELSLEELRILDYDEQDAYFKRLRSMVHYKTTTQSLTRADLEASYQSFIRDQVAQQSPRYELEQFVRNSADIDSAKRYVDVINEVLINPPQSLLLYRSSKLNEQKANLLKTSSCNNILQELNNDPSIQKYFPPIGHDKRRIPSSDEDDFFGSKINSASCHSMHVKYNDKKYHVQFLKKYGLHRRHYQSDQSTTDHHLCLPEHEPPRHVESLLSAESSINQVTSSGTRTSTLHREIFPPLSITALKEYRPIVTPKEPSSRQTSSTINSQQHRRKPPRKKDFLWNQSIVSSTKHE